MRLVRAAALLAALSLGATACQEGAERGSADSVALDSAGALPAVAPAGGAARAAARSTPSPDPFFTGAPDAAPRDSVRRYISTLTWDTPDTGTITPQGGGSRFVVQAESGARELSPDELRRGRIVGKIWLLDGPGIPSIGIRPSDTTYVWLEGSVPQGMAKGETRQMTGGRTIYVSLASTGRWTWEPRVCGLVYHWHADGEPPEPKRATFKAAEHLPCAAADGVRTLQGTQAARTGLWISCLSGCCYTDID